MKGKQISWTKSFTANGGGNHKSVVDISCGIGTQAIGLAKLNYDVRASDLSSVGIERAKQEAQKRNLTIDFSIADMREAYQHHRKQFDVLISCDNSIPHLLTDSEILGAFKEFHSCLKPGGGCIITLRDYEKESRGGIQVKPYGVKVVDGTKHLMFQTWEFEGDIYNLSMYLISDHGQNNVQTKVFRSRYYAISICKIIELMNASGFVSVKKKNCDFYQPVIVGTKI